MIGGEFEKGVDLSRRMSIQSIAVIPPKWTNIRNSHIPPNREDMRSIADILVRQIAIVKISADTHNETER